MNEYLKIFTMQRRSIVTENLAELARWFRLGAPTNRYNRIERTINKLIIIY